jgi:Tfp pilus assembly protein FimT
MRKNNIGFSLLEVMTVAAISLAVTMTAVPNMISGIGNVRLRSSMTSLAGVLQNCRMLAVKQNRAMTTHFVTTNYGGASGVMAYVKLATDVSSLGATDSQVQLEQPVTRVTTLSGPGAPTIALDLTYLGFTPQNGDPSFNPTGLPCNYSGGNCSNAGFVYYFHDSRPAGKQGWAALSISPAGRLKKWYWNGSTWTD